MTSSPDVLYTVKGFDLDINQECNTGVLSVHFCLSGSRLVQLEAPEILAPVIIEHDEVNDKPVYKLGEITQYTSQALSREGGAELEDFDTLMTHSTELDFGIPSSSSSASNMHFQQQQEQQQEGALVLASNSTEFEEAGNFHSKKKPLATMATQQRSSLTLVPFTATTSSIAVLVGDDDEFSALKPISPSSLMAAPILAMDRPKQGGKMSFSHYCYDGYVKMHLDADSLVYFNEFRMHNPYPSDGRSDRSSSK